MVTMGGRFAVGPSPTNLSPTVEIGSNGLRVGEHQRRYVQNAEVSAEL